MVLSASGQKYMLTFKGVPLMEYLLIALTSIDASFLADLHITGSIH